MNAKAFKTADPTSVATIAVLRLRDLFHSAIVGRDLGQLQRHET
jgi:hypothetical protein